MDYRFTEPALIPKMRALKKKGKVQENFLRALREYAKERR